MVMSFPVVLPGFGWFGSLGCLLVCECGFSGLDLGSGNFGG